jgi:hypothetical protein
LRCNNLGGELSDCENSRLAVNRNFRFQLYLWAKPICLLPVVAENSVRSENAEVMTIRAIMVASTMSSLFVAPSVPTENLLWPQKDRNVTCLAFPSSHVDMDVADS